MPISLRISGTKMRQAGFSPLVNVGIFPTELNQDLDRNFSAAKRIFVLLHREDYIAIVLYDQLVKSFDTNAAGLLAIALTIPRGERLAGGMSPYTLLIDAYRRFQVLYMNPQADGYNIFKDIRADSNIFNTIVDSYSLEAAPGRYIEMNTAGTSGALSVPQRQMEAFFRDTQYPEFASFKEIQIAPELISTPSLAQLEIPRKERWEVFINGESTGKCIDADIPTCSVKAKDTDNYEFPEVTVNLYDVLNAVDGDLRRDGVRWAADYKSMRILGNQQGQEIMYKVVVVLPEEQRQKEYIWSYKRLDDLQILLGRLEINEGTAISANQFNQNPITVVDRNSSAQYKISGAARLDKVNRIVKICLSLNRNYVHEPYRPSVPDSDNVSDKTGESRNSVSAATEQGQKRYEELQAKYDQLNNNYKKIEDNNNSLNAENRCLNRKFKIAVAGCVLLLIWGLCLIIYFHRERENQPPAQMLQESIEEKERLISTWETQFTSLQETLAKRDEEISRLKSKIDSLEKKSAQKSSRELVADILTAVCSGKKLDAVKKMEGYKDYLNEKQREAIVWLLDTTTCMKNKDGKFYGNPAYDYNIMMAHKIDNVREKYRKENRINLQSLDSCYTEIMNILKGNHVTESNGGE